MSGYGPRYLPVGSLEVWAAERFRLGSYCLRERPLASLFFFCFVTRRDGCFWKEEPSWTEWNTSLWVGYSEDCRDQPKTKLGADETEGTLEANPGGWTYIEVEGAQIRSEVR